MLQAFCLLALMKLGLSIFTYRQLIHFLPVRGHARASGWVKTRTARALQRAARYLPSATCLPQALAGHVMLALQGYESHIRIGVAPSGDAFRAHAWLMCDEDILIGDSEDLVDFVRLTDIKAGTR